MNANQADALRERTAELSIGPSTWRARGCGGTAKAGKRALKTIDLTKFQVGSRAEFLQVLNSETTRVKRYFPAGCRHWGVARKYINIYLRSCVYNRSLARHYGITHIVKWLELPLDSHVADGISICSCDQRLPSWDAIMRLSSEDSMKYQNAARRIARKKGVLPVDLEWCWWRNQPSRCKCANKV